MSKAYFNIAILAVLCTICFGTKAQSDSRLALVIGNSNYANAPLSNPNNDAQLVAATLKSLDFDVLLGLDLKTKSDFVSLVREFGAKRPNYDVAFVYYAGHGIQIGSQNYLLPTEETFQSEFDVEDFGVSVSRILRYLNGVSDKVNVLILDACRNNPFEQNWNTQRALTSGQGLAKIPPPTGSLIAFSTEAGQTAADGNNESNSIYCQSLCANFSKPGTSLDQVFRNVRSDVLARTSGSQRPIEASQLTGEAFYLIPPKIVDLRVEAIELMMRQEYDSALAVVNSILLTTESTAEDLITAGHISMLKGNKTKSIEFYRQALEKSPNNHRALVETIRWENTDADLGLIYALEGFPQEVLELEREYMPVLENNFEFRLAIARSLLWSFEREKALARLQSMQLVELRDWVLQDGEDSQVVAELLSANFTYVYEFLEEWEEAAKWAQNSIDIGSQSPWPYISLARIQLELDSVDYLLYNDLMTRAIEKIPDVDRILRHEMIFQWIRNNTTAIFMHDVRPPGVWSADKCIEMFYDFLDTSEDALNDLIAHYHLGRLYTFKGSYFRAVSELSIAVSKEMSVNELSWLYFVKAANRVALANAYCLAGESDLECESLVELTALSGQFEEGDWDDLSSRWYSPKNESNLRDRYENCVLK